MVGSYITRSSRAALTMLLGSILAFHSASAQTASPVTLDDILLRLENNLHRYHTEIPSFFCAEHVISQVVPGSRTITDSVFRLKRLPGPDQTTTLTESRDVKTVNGQPAQADEIKGPSIVNGAFSGGLSIVSLSQKACLRYKLQPIKRGNSVPYVIEFESVPASERTAACSLQEDGTGHVLIDPATMEIKRMELHVPHHTIIPARKTANGFNIPPVMGTWDLAVDYGPVLLEGKTFWMPQNIVSSSIAGFVDDRTVWSFKANYSNYHKLEVTTRILPANDATAP